MWGQPTGSWQRPGPPAATGPTPRLRPPVVHAEAVTKVYGEGPTAVVALDRVSVDIAPAQFTAVMGPSGSGKSTLMHCLAGLDRPTEGTVYLGRTNVTALDDDALTELRRDRIGFIFQAFNLVPTLTAYENIVLPSAIAGFKPDPAWLDLVIDVVGLSSRLDHLPTELSGGQQQRVACARALAGQPEVIFADEPTGNLDSTAGGHILNFLRHNVREYGHTIVMVTHDAVAASYCDRVIFLADGTIRHDMTNPTPSTVLAAMSRLDQRRPSALGPGGPRP